MSRINQAQVWTIHLQSWAQLRLRILQWAQRRRLSLKIPNQVPKKTHRSRRLRLTNPNQVPKKAHRSQRLIEMRQQELPRRPLSQVQVTSHPQYFAARSSQQGYHPLY